jgi:two-component system sensor kinase FixL
MINLVRNAVEAMQDSSTRSLLIATTQDEDDSVRVSVADTGPGLAPDVAASLFQPFVTTKASGLGIGLSICRTIVESHGGRLWMEPNAGGGTVFHFRLPAAQDGADDGT